MKELVLPNGKELDDCFIDVEGNVYREINGKIKKLRTW